jgi:hypothetical protein
VPSLDRTVGALSFPLSATGETDLASLDPARDILLALFYAAINDELGPRWASAVTGTKLTSAATPLVAKFPFEPDRETLTQFKATFPALFVYRDSSSPTRKEEFTLSQRKYTKRWGVDYFLGPLDVGDRGKISDILNAVGACISEVVERGGHKAYATTTLDSGTVIAKRVFGPWGTGTCGFSSIDVVEYAHGPAALSREDPKYWACSCVLETVELDGHSENAFLDWYDGAEATIGTGNADGEIEDLVVVNTDTALNIWDP